MTDPIKDLIENLKKKGVNVDENNIRASLTNQKSASEFYKQNESELGVDKDYFMSFVNTPTRFEVEHENANRQLRNTERDYQRLQNKLRDDAEKGVQSADQLFSDVEVLEKRRNDLQQTVSKLNEKARTKSRFDLEQEFDPSEFESAIVSSKLDKDVIKSNKSTKAFITEESDKLVPFLSDQEKEVYAPIKQIQLEEDSNTSLKQMVDNLSSKKRTQSEEMQFVAAKNALNNSNKKIDELKGFYQRKKTEIESSATDFIKQKKAEKTAIINTLLPEGIKDEDLVQKMIADDPELDKKIRQIDKDIEYANTKIGGFLTQPKAVLSDKEDLLNRIDYLLPGISADPLTKVKAYAVAKNRILQDLKNILAHPKGDESAKEIYSIPEKMIAIEEELAELAPIALLNRSNSADVQKYSDSIYKNISVALKNSGIAIASKFLDIDAKYDSPKIQAEIIEKSLNIIGEKQNVRPDIYDQTFGNPEEASALFDENQKLLNDRVFKDTKNGQIEYWKSNKSREKYYSNLKEIESKRGELNQSDGFYSGLEMAGLSFKIGVDLFLSSVLVETGIGVGVGTAKALTTVKNIEKIRGVINKNKVVKATFENLKGIKDTGNYTRGQKILSDALAESVKWEVASQVVGGKAWDNTGGSEGFLGGAASAVLEQAVPKPIIGLLSGPGKSKLRDFALKFAGQLPVEYVQENAEQFATTVKESTGSSNFLTGAAEVIANGLKGGEKWESIKEDFSKTMGWEAQKEMSYATAFLSTMFATGSGMGEVFKNMYLDNGGDAKMLEDMSFYLNGVKKIVYDRNTYHYTGERWVDKNKKEVAPEIAAKLNEASPNTKLGDVKELESVASFVKGEWVSENGTKLEGDSLDKIIHGFRGLEEQESVVSDYKTKDVKIAEIEKDEKLTDEEKSQNIQAIPEDNFIQSDEDVIEAKQGQVLYTKNNSVFYTTKQEGSKAVSLSSDSKLVKFEDGKYYIEQKSPIEGSYEVTSGSEFRLAQAIKAANTRQGRALRTVRAFIPITKAIKKSVNGKLQGLKIVLHDGESYSKLDKGSRGHYDKASHTVHLNLSSSLGVTANHEILHPFFNAIFDATPNAKDLFYSQVSQEYKDRYQDVDEAIVEYASDRIVYAATPKLDTDPNFFARIFNNARDIVSRFAGRDAMPLDTDLNSLIGAMAQVGTQRGNNPIIKYLEGLSNKEVDTGSQKTWTERAMSILGIPNATVNGIPYSNEDISRQLEEGLDKTISKIKDTFKKIEGFDYEASELASEHISDSAKEWVDYLENSNAPIEFRALLAAELFEYKYDGTYKERNGGIFDEFNEKHIKEVLQEGKKEGLLKQLYDKKQAAIQQQKIEDENTISEQLRKEQEQERERSGGKDTVEEYTDQLSKIKNYAAEVISNRAEIQRLSKEDERGRIEGGIRNVEATILLAASGRESGQIKGREEQQRAIEDYAKAEGIWYDNIDANPDIGTIQNGLGKYKDSGMENQVYIPIDNPNIVRKTMKTTDPTNKDNDNEVLYHLDTRISAHNAGIGSTAPYTVIGFGRLSNGDFVVISEQPHIQDARMATREEISDEMQKMGYDLDGKDSFSDQDHFITDINPKNVLVSKEGTFHFIDTIYDIFNVNDEDSNRLSGIIQRQKIEDKSPLADIVNGFYSNTENALLQVPQEKMSGSKWKSQLLSRGANSDEMKWTTLLNYLEDNKDKSVSKNDIRQYLKDNRIQVVEVVKDGGISEEEIDTLLNDEVGQDMTRDEARAFLENDERQDDTKFSQYQLEGEKENYKEVLVTMPSRGNLKERWGVFDNKGKLVSSYNSELKAKQKSESIGGTYKMASNVGEADPKVNFKSSHFDEPNILVHLRMNTRTDSEGNKLLFLEEIQRDVEKETDLGKKEAGLPFSKTTDYVKLAWKVALREAIAQGVDKIAWTTGEQQNDRYDLQKQVDFIDVFTNDDGTYHIEAVKGNETISKEKSLKAEQLEGLLGKDLASKIIEDTKSHTHKEGEENLVKTYRGKDLSVGGKGMKGFYGSPYQFKSTIKVNKDRINFTLNEAVAEVYFEGGVISEELPTWAKNEIYLANIENKGVKGDGKIVIEELKEKAKQLGADILTLRADMGVGFGGINSKLYKYYKDLGFQDINPLNPDGRMYFDLRKYESKGSLGIVGNVAKSLFKQEPKTVTIKGGKGSIDATSVDAIWVEYNGIILPENKREDYKFNDNEFVFTIDNNVAYRLYDKNDIKDAKNRDVYTIPRGNYFTQHSIDITPELKAETQQGLPMFQKIEDLPRFNQRQITDEFIDEDWDTWTSAITLISAKDSYVNALAIIDEIIAKRKYQNDDDELNDLLDDIIDFDNSDFRNHHTAVLYNNALQNNYIRFALTARAQSLYEKSTNDETKKLAKYIIGMSRLEMGDIARDAALSLTSFNANIVPTDKGIMSLFLPANANTDKVNKKNSYKESGEQRTDIEEAKFVRDETKKRILEHLEESGNIDDVINRLLDKIESGQISPPIGLPSPKNTIDVDKKTWAKNKSDKYVSKGLDLIKNGLSHFKKLGVVPDPQGDAEAIFDIFKGSVYIALGKLLKAKQIFSEIASELGISPEKEWDKYAESEVGKAHIAEVKRTAAIDKLKKISPKTGVKETRDHFDEFFDRLRASRNKNSKRIIKNIQQKISELGENTKLNEEEVKLIEDAIIILESENYDTEAAGYEARVGKIDELQEMLDALSSKESTNPLSQETRRRRKVREIVKDSLGGKRALLKEIIADFIKYGSARSTLSELLADVLPIDQAKELEKEVFEELDKMLEESSEAISKEEKKNREATIKDLSNKLSSLQDKNREIEMIRGELSKLENSEDSPYKSRQMAELSDRLERLTGEKIDKNKTKQELLSDAKKELNELSSRDNLTDEEKLHKKHLLSHIKLLESNAELDAVIADLNRSIKETSKSQKKEQGTKKTVSNLIDKLNKIKEGTYTARTNKEAETTEEIKQLRKQIQELSGARSKLKSLTDRWNPEALLKAIKMGAHDLTDFFAILEDSTDFNFTPKQKKLLYHIHTLVRSSITGQNGHVQNLAATNKAIAMLRNLKSQTNKDVLKRFLYSMASEWAYDSMLSHPSSTINSLLGSVSGYSRIIVEAITRLLKPSDRKAAFKIIKSVWGDFLDSASKAIGLFFSQRSEMALNDLENGFMASGVIDRIWRDKFKDIAKSDNGIVKKVAKIIIKLAVAPVKLMMNIFSATDVFSRNMFRSWNEKWDVYDKVVSKRTESGLDILNAINEELGLKQEVYDQANKEADDLGYTLIRKREYVAKRVLELREQFINDYILVAHADHAARKVMLINNPETSVGASFYSRMNKLNKNENDASYVSLVLMAIKNQIIPFSRNLVNFSHKHLVNTTIPISMVAAGMGKKAEIITRQSLVANLLTQQYDNYRKTIESKQEYDEMYYRYKSMDENSPEAKLLKRKLDEFIIGGVPVFRNGKIEKEIYTKRDLLLDALESAIGYSTALMIFMSYDDDETEQGIVAKKPNWLRVTGSAHGLTYAEKDAANYTPFSIQVKSDDGWNTVLKWPYVFAHPVFFYLGSMTDKNYDKNTNYGLQESSVAEILYHLASSPLSQGSQQGLQTIADATLFVSKEDSSEETLEKLWKSLVTNTARQSVTPGAYVFMSELNRWFTNQTVMTSDDPFKNQLSKMPFLDGLADKTKLSPFGYPYTQPIPIKLAEYFFEDNGQENELTNINKYLVENSVNGVLKYYNSGSNISDDLQGDILIKGFPEEKQFELRDAVASAYGRIVAESNIYNDTKDYKKDYVTSKKALQQTFQKYYEEAIKEGKDLVLREYVMGIATEELEKETYPEKNGKQLLKFVKSKEDITTAMKEWGIRIDDGKIKYIDKMMSPVEIY